MVNSYYGIYQAERGKTTAEMADAHSRAAEVMHRCSGAMPPPAGRTLRD